MQLLDVAYSTGGFYARGIVYPSHLFTPFWFSLSYIVVLFISTILFLSINCSPFVYGYNTHLHCVLVSQHVKPSIPSPRPTKMGG